MPVALSQKYGFILVYQLKKELIKAGPWQSNQERQDITPNLSLLSYMTPGNQNNANWWHDP